MERLTIPDEKIEGGVRRTVIDSREVKKNAMAIYWALKKYEDTGLTPTEIIRKHMNDKAEDGGWIPVEERLPEEKKSVLVQWEKYDRHLNVTLTYLDVMWLEDEEDVVFETINGIPNGRVIAWRPLPEPYRPERSDNHDRE